MHVRQFCKKSLPALWLKIRTSALFPKKSNVFLGFVQAYLDAEVNIQIFFNGIDKAS